MALNGNDDICPDWLYSDSSNVHVAKDKIWFTSYQPFGSQLGCTYNIGTPMRVLGIGTIKFRVKALPGSWTPSTIELHNVLHVPSYVCNVLGRPLADVYDIDLVGLHRKNGPNFRGGLFLQDQQIAHFHPAPMGVFPLAVLSPAGEEFTASPFSSEVMWTLSCHWDHGERVRWQAVQTQTAPERKTPNFEPPYTVRELEWVNAQWGTEFRFLDKHRLGIHEEADRSEGRRIVRALRTAEDPFEKEGQAEIVINGKMRDYERVGGSRRYHTWDLVPPKVTFLG